MRLFQLPFGPEAVREEIVVEEIGLAVVEEMGPAVVEEIGAAVVEEIGAAVVEELGLAVVEESWQRLANARHCQLMLANDG